VFSSQSIAQLSCEEVTCCGLRGSSAGSTKAMHGIVETSIECFVMDSSFIDGQVVACFASNSSIAYAFL
jgi:hypothetical protein